MVLVNPSKVRSVPIYAGNKMRVSEMFIVGAVSLDDYSQKVYSSDVDDYSDLYYSETVEELSKSLEDKSFEKVICQDKSVSLPIEDIVNITNTLKKRVIEI